MAKITLDRLRHSYLAAPSAPEDYALKEIDLDWGGKLVFYPLGHRL